MARTVRMTLAEAMAATPVRRPRPSLLQPTQADIRRHMIEDGEDPDAPLPAMRRVVPAADVRKHLGMSQPRFAAFIGVPVGTLRNWEQGRVMPDPAARALLTILDREPTAALRALQAP